MRILPHAWLLYKVVMDFDIFPNTYSWAIAFIGMALMNYLNVDLLTSLYTAEYLKDTKKKNSKKTKILKSRKKN